MCRWPSSHYIPGQLRLLKETLITKPAVYLVVISKETLFFRLIINSVEGRYLALLSSSI